MLQPTDFTPGTQLHGFTVQSSAPLPEIDGAAHVMRHEHSGARLLFLQNQDENKTFSIAFKTPPADDTGVFHILEHSVLCGSDKFPVKEPFVNLLKTSMQTFLNALTFPDKTMYPVASTNEQDLLNLIDVYMDAVLHPAIYDKRAIFEQEGWHYELDEPGNAGEGVQPLNAADAGEGPQIAEGGCAGDAPQPGQAANVPQAEQATNAPQAEQLSHAPQPLNAADAAADQAEPERLRYNGVVFNEMKGALSDPDSVLYHAMNKALFPNTCYAFESGGHPRAIPQLTYEGYLDTHARHYRLDNSYIVLYGNLDAERVLAFIDGRYLSAADCAPRTDAAPNEIGFQEPFVAPDAVVPMNTMPENATVGMGYVVGTAHDFERVLACDVLLDALMGGNESPMKRALLDEGLGGDAVAYLIDSQLQPVALFQLKGTNLEAYPDAAQRFRAAVEQQAQRLVREGIPRDVLEASLAQLSFDLRERDRGMADGVPLAMNALAGWLYDDAAATKYLRYEEALAHMRAGLDGRYFEDLLESLVVSSEHKALVDIRPQDNGDESEEAAELAAALQAMTPADKQAVRDDVDALRAMQEAPDSPEALATLPKLHVSDIGEAKPDPAFAVLADRALPCLFHDLPTRHIDYATVYFDIDHLSWEDLPYVSILAMVLTRLDTESHTAAELDVLMRSHLGSLRFSADAYVNDDDPSDIALKMAVSASALSEEVAALASIPREVWESTRFDDAGKIRDVLVQRRIAMEQAFANDGHARAMSRLASYEFKSGVLRECMGGVDFYLFLKDVLEHFDERFDGLKQQLERVRAKVFEHSGVTVSFTGSAADLDRFWECAGDLGLSGFSAPAAGRLSIPEPVVKNEAFIVASDVCFVAKGADVSAAGQYDGAWAVLANALSFDYLWNEVRVKGGAYGVGFRRTPEGFARFYSFRDPSVDATLERFDQAAQWLEAFDPDADEMEGYIVSTVASHDAPVKPRQIARRQDVAYFCEKPEGHRERLRAQKLATTPDQLRSFAKELAMVARSNAVCVFGGEDIVRSSKAALSIVELLG